MATEEQKKANQLRLANLTLFGITAGFWELLGDTALAIGPQIGEQVLKVMEKEMGLEIAGEKPEEVLTEIARLFVDEFGFASNIEVVTEGNTITMKVHNCLNRSLTDRLMEAGVEKPFICPIMNSGFVAMRRLGIKAHPDVVKWTEGNGSIITFRLTGS
jgi:hypothetical protein